MRRANKPRVKWLCVGGVAALAAAPRVLSAQSAAEPVRFAYTAPVDCPGEAHFRDEVSGRTSKFRVAAENEPARAFTVFVDGDAVQATGFVEVRGLDGTASRRAVGRGTCGEVVSALALITAVAIDPDATASVAPPPSAAASPASAGPTNPEPGPVVVPPAPAVARPVEPVVDAPAAPPPDARTSRRVVDLTAGASSEIFLGLVPRISVGGGAFFSVTPAEQRTWVPEGRLTLLAAGANASFSGNVGADLIWAMARLEGCVLDAALARRVALGPCLGVDAGLLRSAGTGVAHPDSATRPWFALDAQVLVEWEPFTSVVVNAGGGITVPLRRYPFSYGADTGQTTLAYRLNAVAGALNLGLGFRFR